MVKYVRIGASRMYVPAAFERLVTAARIAFIRDEDQADPGTEIDLLGLLHRGAVVVYPTVTEAVATSLYSNLPRLLDEATLPGQRIRLAFLTASGGLRAGDTLSMFLLRRDSVCARSISVISVERRSRTSGPSWNGHGRKRAPVKWIYTKSSAA